MTFATVKGSVLGVLAPAKLASLVNNGAMTQRGLGALAVAVAITGYGHSAQAQQWWDSAWPYRIEVVASGSGVVEADIDFGAELDALGLNRAIVDLRSLRVVPYDAATPGTPIPYAESYSVLLDDADDPQVGWSDSGVYWTVNDGSAQADGSRFSQGLGSLQVVIQNLAGGYGYPGVELHIADGDPLSNWSRFDAFLYDIWPNANGSALDQAPDLYSFKLYGTGGCESSSVTQGGPGLALDQWNRVSVPLSPLDTCQSPELSAITRLEFHTRDNDTVDGNSGLYDDGDEVTLWFDDVRLVDQNEGSLRWETDGSASSYFVYFDVLEHEGHPPPSLAAVGAPTIQGTPGAAEAGGYFHLVSGSVATDLQIWGAPAIEKITKGHAVPTHSAPLRIQAAKNEFEPVQIVVRSPTDQQLAVSVSDFMSESGVITSMNVAIHRVDYVPLTRTSDRFGRIGDTPDPLYPIEAGTTVAFPANQNQPLWLTVYVPPSAPAGIYQATVTVGTATIPVSLEVWDFALSQEIHLQSEWGFGWSEIVELYKGTVSGSVEPCYWDLVDALYQDFARHRLVPKGVGWPAGLNYPGGVEYDCEGGLDPEVWGEWGFADLAERYLQGKGLGYSDGFPSFLIQGPASNWPPDSRPSEFCGESRGDELPGDAAYNASWFQYWTAVSDYLASSGYAGRGYYHIVNEPQTFEDYDITAYLAQQTKAAAPNVLVLLSEQVEPAIYDNPTYPGAKIDIWVPTITNYQVERAHDRQLNFGEQVWWYFLYGDQPPLPNPTIIDRTGLEARIIPWLAWAERVDGLLYYSTTDFSPSPWTEPWINDANGDGFMFYPPKDSTVAFDACDAQSNRLVPSIRWELLREGMEDYEYFWLLNEGKPTIAQSTSTDTLVSEVVRSRTLFSRVPTDIYAARARVAAQITGESCADECARGTLCDGDVLVVCDTNNAGCLQESRTNCAAAANGTCDASASACAATGGGSAGSGGTGPEPSAGSGGTAPEPSAGSGGAGVTASSGRGGSAATRGAVQAGTTSGDHAAGKAGDGNESSDPGDAGTDDGCGCRVIRSASDGARPWFVLVALAGLLARRGRGR